MTTQRFLVNPEHTALESAEALRRNIIFFVNERLERSQPRDTNISAQRRRELDARCGGLAMVLNFLIDLRIGEE